MPPLSEKARGKQRASNADTSDELISTPSHREITVRFTEGIHDLVVLVGEKDSIRDLKDKIRHARVEIANRRLRLIHSGKLLTDGTLLHPLFVSLEERQKRANSSELEHAVSKEWLHCSVGPVILTGEDVGEETGQESQIQPLRGFDRLQAAGFSAEDIATMRRQFHSESFSTFPENDLGDDDDERARVLEEQWIDSIDTTGSAALSQSSSSTSSSTLQGLLLGFFFPILPFFFFREPPAPIFWDNGREPERPPSVIFTKRMQMAIVIGFVLNVTFGLWRFLLAS